METTSTFNKEKKATDSMASSSSTESRSNVLGKQFIEEQLNLVMTPALAKHVGNEIFLYSCVIVKYNQYGWRNTRTLLATQESIMLLKNKDRDLRRKLAIEQVEGLTMSYHHESSEMVIHVREEPDIRIVSPGYRSQIIDTIKMFYLTKTRFNLPIYGVRQKSLKVYQQQQSDIEKGISRTPLPLARLTDQDLVKIDEIQRKKSALIQVRRDCCDDDIEQLGKNLENYIVARNQSIAEPVLIEELDDSAVFFKTLDHRRQTKNKHHDLDDPMQGEHAENIYQRSTVGDRVLFEQFKTISVLGQGTFAKVYLVYLPGTEPRLYALKSMRKDVMMNHNSVENIGLEKMIMLQVNHPFIVQMQFVFQREYRVYFMMDFMAGGELFRFMQKERRFQQEKVCFYIAQIALALDHLHKSDILYRDLKPENILIDTDGYIKLSDFGLAKRALESNTFCGTPEYIAPEILAGVGYTKTADWWALGILTYEMLTGVPPFYDKDRNVMFHNIETAPIRWPESKLHGFTISLQAQHFIYGLLIRDNTKRLGSNGGAEVLAHPFLRQINQGDLLQKKVMPPYIPEAPSPSEIVKQFESQQVDLKDLNETRLPTENKKQVMSSQDRFFASFGTNIDSTQKSSVITGATKGSYGKLPHASYEKSEQEKKS